MVETPPAWVLLKRARERIYTLPPDFPGFRAGRAALDLFRAAYLQEGFVEVGP
ncbi:hypothetical protein [Thermus thermophilus]|uniref:Uncharacterized protein n=1 Tax=Thermus thermophilus TaxID=274 RepID=A0A7R7YJ20_THETH|nr:hypothetical protein [Thermus thermophilus]BCP67254.1 hypothetical protein TthHB5018_b21880 [Thermus thermophilus]